MVLKPHAWLLRPEAWIHILEACRLTPGLFGLDFGPPRYDYLLLRPEHWQTVTQGHEILAELRALAMESNKELSPHAWGPKPEGLVFEPNRWELRPRIRDALRPGVWVLTPSAWGPKTSAERAAQEIPKAVDEGHAQKNPAAALAGARHAENRIIKQEAHAYWQANIGRDVPATKAAAMLREIVPMEPRTLTRWVREWKKM